MALPNSQGTPTTSSKLARMTRATFADYLTWDDDQRWEIIDGQPYAMSSPTTLHQALVTEFLMTLGAHFKDKPCRVLPSPLDVKLSDHDVVQPDLLVVCRPEQITRSHIDGAPQLVVEILSSSSLRHDRVRKLNLYGRSGVGEYWLITPDPFIVEVLHNREGVFTTVGAYTEADTLLSPSFPEIRIDLGEIFTSLPQQL
jgi:Uma2 family endonuclease